MSALEAQSHRSPDAAPSVEDPDSPGWRPIRGRVAVYIDWPNMAPWDDPGGYQRDAAALVRHLHERYRPSRIILYAQQRYVLPSLPKYVTRKDTIKDVDSALITDALLPIDRFETVVLLSGDNDFWYPLQALKSRGSRIEVYGPRKGTGKFLREIADYFAYSDTLDGLRRLAAAEDPQPPPPAQPAAGLAVLPELASIQLANLAATYRERLRTEASLRVPEADVYHPLLAASLEVLETAPDGGVSSHDEWLALAARRTVAQGMKVAPAEIRGALHLVRLAGCAGKDPGGSRIRVLVADRAEASGRIEARVTSRLAHVLGAPPDGHALAVMFHGRSVQPDIVARTVALVSEVTNQEGIEPQREAA